MFLPQRRRESYRTCRACGCTDVDCRHCIQRMGEACHWVKSDLCSACAGGLLVEVVLGDIPPVASMQIGNRNWSVRANGSMRNAMLQLAIQVGSDVGADGAMVIQNPNGTVHLQLKFKV